MVRVYRVRVYRVRVYRVRVYMVRVYRVRVYTIRVYMVRVYRVRVYTIRVYTIRVYRVIHLRGSMGRDPSLLRLSWHVASPANLLQKRTEVEVDSRLRLSQPPSPFF